MRVAPNTTQIPALILAGGASRRMGAADKPLLLLAGRSMLGHILDRLVLHHAHIAISANGDPARFRTSLPILPDPIPGQGPLSGVLAGLDWAAGLGAHSLLTVPGDTPLIPANLAQALMPAPAVAESAGRRHHLVALWPVSAVAPLRAWLAQPGSRSVRGFAETLPMRAVAFAGDPFANANTPADLATLTERVQAGT